MMRLLLAALFATLATAGALAAGSYPVVPDASTTPGVVASTDQRDVCGVVGGLTYSKRHRHTSTQLKRAIRRRDHAQGTGEVDHRLPLSLGGADVEGNLWWEPGPDVEPTWNFKVKDALEDYAYEAVCHRGTMTLQQAQQIFVGEPDWRVPYCRLVGKNEPRCAKSLTGAGE